MAAEEPKAPFSLGPVTFNESSWGPTGVPERFAAVPFASFNRSDRIGKVADFGNFTRYTGRRYGRYGEENVELNYRYDAEEAREFNRVEKGGKIVSGAVAAPAAQRGGMRNAAGAKGPRGAPSAGAGGAGTKGYDDRSARAAGRTGIRGGRDDRAAGKLGGKGMQGKRMPMRRGPGGVAQREFSVNVTADWLLLESVELSQLAKLSVSKLPEGTDLRWAGTLAPYDEEFDRVNTKATRRIKAFSDLDFFYQSAEADPVLQGE
jgi:translation initiation factor 3 subunit D